MKDKIHKILLKLALKFHKTKKLFRKYFTSSFFLNAPLVVKTLIALVTLPIVLANLPIADYGKWQFILAIQIWLLAFTAGNVTSASKRGIAKGLNGTFLYAFLARLKLSSLAGFLVLGVAFALKILNDNIISVLLMIIGLYLIFGYLFQISFYEFLIAKRRFKESCIWQILISFISMIGSALIAYFTKNIIYFALFQLGSSSILSCIAWFWIVKKEKLFDSYKKDEIDKGCVHYGLKLIPVDLVAITANKIPHFIIGSFFGFANLAVFSTANALREKCNDIIKTSRLLLYADFAEKKRDELIESVNKHLIKLGFFGIILMLGFTLVAWGYIKFFLPVAYHQAIIYFAILILGLPAALVAIVLHTTLESHLRYKELTVIGTIPNILRIVFILVFGYLWQIIGICVAFVIINWISFGFYYLLTSKREIMIDFANRHLWLEKLIKKY